MVSTGKIWKNQWGIHLKMVRIPWDLGVAYFQTHPYQNSRIETNIDGGYVSYVYIHIYIVGSSSHLLHKTEWIRVFIGCCIIPYRQLNYLSNNQAGYEIVIHPQFLLLSPQFLLLNVKPGSIYHKGVVLIRIDISHCFGGKRVNTETVNPGLTWVFHS